MNSSRPSSQHFKLSRVLFGGMLAVSMSFALANTAHAAPATHFDFGTATTQPGYVVVDASKRFTPELGYGWLDTAGLDVRDRQQPDDLRGDFVMGKTPQTFRIAGLAPGRYQLQIVCGDTDYGDHILQVKIPGAGELPSLSPKENEFQTLTATVNTTGTLDITVSSTGANWVVNSLSLEPTQADTKPVVTSQTPPPQPVKSTWDPTVFQTDPTKPLLTAFLANAAKGAPANFHPTTIKRADYLKLISSEVDFWKGHQDTNGAIIDPYKKEEWQYSTPAFARAAATLVAYDKRDDLLEPAAKAMDWATLRLSQRQAASGHEDFYPPMLAHALMLLKGRVAPERAAKWESNLRSYNPYKTYRQGLGSMNWNIVSSSGEYLLQKLGIRDTNTNYVDDSLAAQGHLFNSPYGVYLEGPMAYDHFPRHFLADVLAQGYAGTYKTQLSEAIRRAAIASLFMQSPWGELPAGGRSAHHQWNEAEQCVTYEIYAAQALKDGDRQLASVYKRAAHLALASMQRWVRPSGEMQVLKNWVDPAQRFGFETYSAHSQYNLLPMAMLATAYEYAETTEALAEHPSPADIGGFVFEVADLHKIFANAGGTYMEIDTKGDPHYDATGLIRVHSKGLSPQLGPSDSLLSHAAYQSPNPIPMTTGIGALWQGADGAWHNLSSSTIQKVTLTPTHQDPASVAFDVSYEGNLSGPTRLIEHYTITPAGVELKTELPGYTGALRYQWPVLADDGKTPTTIKVGGNTVSVSQSPNPATRTFEARGAQSVQVGTERYSNHNGWSRLAVAEYPQGGPITLYIGTR